MFSDIDGHETGASTRAGCCRKSSVLRKFIALPADVNKALNDLQRQHLCLIIHLRVRRSTSVQKKGGEDVYRDRAPAHRLTALRRTTIADRKTDISIVARFLVNQLTIITKKKYSRCTPFFSGSGYKLTACMCVRSPLTLVLFSGEREKEKEERLIFIS